MKTNEEYRLLEQQLANSQKREANAIAACKLKDEALEMCKPLAAYGIVGSRDVDQAKFQIAISKAIAIQPDDAALRTWLGEPVGEVKKHTGSLKDMAIIVWTGQQPEEGTKLYSPKELK